MKKGLTLVKKKGVETAIIPLQGLKAAAGLIPVPALGPATDIILSILEIAYQSQQNAENCREIADRCLRVHVTLSEHLQSMEITPTLLKSIRRFEVELHNVQEFVKRYRHKTAIRRLFYSKSDNDELQRLGKRVDETLSLFQIERLLSLEEICMKMYASIQHVNQNILRNGASLQRIEQNTVVLVNRSEPALGSKGASVEIVPRSHFTPGEEIINGPDYSLQTAEMRSGKIVTIRVFTGCKAKSTWEASKKVDLNIMHPNLPHLIGTSSPDQQGALFSVYDLDIKDSVEGVIMSWMHQDIDEIMYMCARMVHGISSALNNLSEQARLFDLGAESFDILWDARGRVVLAIHPEVATSSTTTLTSPEDHNLSLLHAMDDICDNIFRKVNHIRYDDDPYRTESQDSPSIQLDEDTSSPATSSQSSNTTVIKPRRELFWQSASRYDTSVHEISQQYGSFVCLKTFCPPVRRVYTSRRPTEHHKCKGYMREELTLTPVILENKVVVHPLPCINEICIICGERIEELSTFEILRRNYLAMLNEQPSSSNLTIDSMAVSDDDRLTDSLSSGTSPLFDTPYSDALDSFEASTIYYTAQTHFLTTPIFQDSYTPLISDADEQMFRS
ncbi:uncharacterized protein EV420DRAFT_1542649, partial [Desarmillaria tabescens]